MKANIMISVHPLLCLDFRLRLNIVLVGFVIALELSLHDLHCRYRLLNHHWLMIRLRAPHLAMLTDWSVKLESMRGGNACGMLHVDSKLFLKKNSTRTTAVFLIYTILGLIY